MKTDNCCSREQLVDILKSTEDQVSSQLEQHLESCSICRQQLEELAGQRDWWVTVGSHLSSTDVRNWNSTSDFAVAGEAQRRAVPYQQLLAAPSHPEMLGRIGRYDVESVIGQGGFGVVFKGFDTELNRPVAIKVLAPHLAASGVARRRFAREAQAAAAVSHPNVVPIHAVDSQAESPYLVMSYVPGHSLQSIVAKYGPLDPKSIVRIGKQIASGLSAAHRQGLVHRDIKPANILLENDLSRAMITDFGLARAADDAAATQTGWLAGTPLYMSPEQARGGDIDARSDLFSLGSVLYYLATGREPFRGESPLAVLRMIGESEPLLAHQINSEIPRELSQVIARLLEKDPRDRFASAEHLEQHLEQYLAHLQQPQACPQPRLGLSRRVKNDFWRIGSAAAVLGLTAVALLGLRWWLPTTPELEPSSAMTWAESLERIQADRAFDQDVQNLTREVQTAERLIFSPLPADFGLSGDPLQQEINRTKSILQSVEISFLEDEKPRQ
ncbi:MAG: serine/threonine-protein kinase [Pirellulaceae bacterium]